MSRGFFSLGIYHPKREVNVGSLWRAGHLYGASMVFTVGARYDRRQSSDTPNVRRAIPLLHFTDMDDLLTHLPHGAPLVGVELDPRATAPGEFVHPRSATYLLGAEDHGLPPAVADRCHSLVQIEAALPYSMNVACAGSILLHHRHTARVGVPA